MSCHSPLNAVVLGIDENGKKKLKFLGKDVVGTTMYPGKELLQVPCGQCMGCRVDRSKEWANRCMLELKYHDSAYFVTLTYDDEHLPKTIYERKVVLPEMGERDEHSGYTLRKTDFQLWMKRLRRRFEDDKIRFFACGEYGGETKRPHYHAILFGLHLDDLVRYKTVKQGDGFYTYYNSPSLQDTWNKGFVVVGDVTWESCAYVARYVTKKLNGADRQFYVNFNLEPEFSLMSRRPGIARDYYDDHSEDIYKYEFINVSTPKGGKKFRPPRYYDKLFEIDYPEIMADKKQKRIEKGNFVMDAKMKHTNLSPPEIQKVEENAFGNKIKSLRRSTV